MSEFDVIVVGAGPAGASAAIKLASSGANVLLVERGDPPGSKNVSGGVLWGDSLGSVIPDWEKAAPMERYVEAKGVSFLTKDSKISLDFRSRKLQERRSGYTVLRTKLDQWLSKKAKESGAMVAAGITVDKLAFKDKQVVGIEQDEDIITANTVILAEGANPRVAINSGIRKKLVDKDVAIGVKEIIKLPEKTINERFNLTSSKMGFASEYVLGYLEGGVKAGGFIYTNKESISLGLVVSLKEMRENDNTKSFDLIEQFKEHPYIAPLIEGGRVDEYSAHLVQEGGINSVPSLYGNGYLVAGDGAGFSFSNGMVLQGMNYAIASGIAAAESALKAKIKSNFSKDSLSSYEARLKSSFVLQDLMNFKGIEEVTWSDMIHRGLPNVSEELLLSLFSETGNPKEHLIKLLIRSMGRADVSRKDMIINMYRMIRRM
ncbi:protein FixC [mine drainage metagenome]|uniref:Protein FixC n=1 Tax=mine drainage metagenome TaxID=410659 RepID=T1ALC6_9ZZZZ